MRVTKENQKCKKENSSEILNKRDSHVCCIDLYKREHLKESCDTVIKSKSCEKPFENLNHTVDVTI